MRGRTGKRPRDEVMSSKRTPQVHKNVRKKTASAWIMEQNKIVLLDEDANALFDKD